MERRLIAASIVLAALFASSCVQFTWQEQRFGRELPTASVDWALDERPDLDVALERLGAPTLVRDREEQGMELVWVWRRTETFDLSVSVPLDRTSASFQGNRFDDRALGLRLVFDHEGRCLGGAQGHVLATR